MFCSKCGQPIEEGNLFCVYCGTKAQQLIQQPVQSAQPAQQVQQSEQPVQEQAHQPEQQIKQPAQPVSPQEYPVEMQTKPRKKISPKPFIITGIVLVVGIILGVYIFKNIKNARKGYDTAEEAAEVDAALLEDEKWEEIVSIVTSEEWEIIFNEYEAGLKDIGIDSIDKLKEEVIKNADDSSFEEFDELLIDDGFEEWEDYGAHQYVYDDAICEYYKTRNFFCYYYFVNCSYEEDVEWDYDEDELNQTILVYYRDGSGKYFSTLGVELAVEVTESMVNGDKYADFDSAQDIYDAVCGVLAYEDAYYETQEYPGGTILATADAGEPFIQAVDGSLDEFMDELNYELEYYLDDDDSPDIEYHGSAVPWNPAGWAIAISDDGRPIVYITDGTTDNMLELMPDLADEYR